MNLTALKQQFIALLGDVYDLEECTALFHLAADKVLNINKVDYLSRQTMLVNQTLADAMIQVAMELSKGKPIQYILGSATFYGLQFYVNSNVLIPRPETEELVLLILKTLAHSSADTLKLLDIGTGTGCIPITLKKYLGHLEASAMDVSIAALDVARTNAELNKVEVQFIHADILNYKSEQRYDVIVSNPPYVKEDEKASMHKNVVDYEPHLALFVSNEDPLLFYKAIAAFSVTNLAENGFLFFEINEYLGPNVRQLLQEYGFRNIEVLKDMQGKDRMVSCQYH